MKKEAARLTLTFGNCSRCFKAGLHNAKCCISKDGTITHCFVIMELLWETKKLFASPVVHPMELSRILGHTVAEEIDVDLGEHPD